MADITRRLRAHDGHRHYRYGGEEFPCILLRETSAEDAMHFAERVRKPDRAPLCRGRSGQESTACFGVSDFSPDKPTPRSLVEAADAAMYESKNAGKNRVSLSSRAPPLAGDEAGPLPA